VGERAFVDRLIARDGAAWERFAREIRPVLVRAAAAVGSRDPEDDAQKICALLLDDSARLLRSFRAQSTFLTWLIGITRNQVLMRLRRDRVNPTPTAPAPARGPLEELVSAESDAQVAAALEALPPRDRLLLVLHYRDGLPHAQVASVVGIAINSVSPLLDRARDRLKAALQKKVD
jgi:RNA polymerase sigma factor (sigma-70 family)